MSAEETDKVTRGMMKRIEKKNAERINKSAILRVRNRKVGFGIAGMVLGVYVYSMWAVKQETVLDELDAIVPTQVKQ